MKSKKVDMLNGKIFPALVKFTIPVALSALLQLLYNAADIMVVGQFAVEEAVGAVGATSSLNHLVIGLFTGFGVGVNVVVGQRIGAGKEKEVPRIINNSLVLSVCSGVFVMFVGLFFSEPLLNIMQTPDGIIDLSAKYFRIVMLGAPALLIYNFCAAALRAYGDTKRPLIYLASSGLVNVAFNVLFVVGFGMDVDGVAIATVISQYMAAAMVLHALLKEKSCCRIEPKKMKLDSYEIWQIIKIGAPAGIYGMMFSLSNVIIQSATNSFDSAQVVSGIAAASSLEGFIWTAMNAVSIGTVSFVSQNWGAKNFRRIKRIQIDSILMVFMIWSVMAAAFFLLQRPLFGLYLPNDSLAVQYGMQRTYIIISTYFLAGIMDALTGSIRGMGYSTITSVISFLGSCVVRVVWIYAVFYPLKGDLSIEKSLFSLYLAYPVSWILTIIGLYICFSIYFNRGKRKLVTPALEKNDNIC